MAATTSSSGPSGISRESVRVRDQDRGRVLDEAGRRRRLRKQLDALEQDNFHEDPHAHLVWNKKLPKFEDPSETKDTASGGSTSSSVAAARKKKRLKNELFKQRFRKTFNGLVEEETIARPVGPNYMSAAAPVSRLPARRLCVVCGFASKYTCTRCGVRYCSLPCRSMHDETRCLKWTA